MWEKGNARYRDLVIDRFVSVDPLFVERPEECGVQECNLYSYAANNPVVYTDATGLKIDQIGLEFSAMAIYGLRIELGGARAVSDGEDTTWAIYSTLSFIHETDLGFSLRLNKTKMPAGQKASDLKGWGVQTGVSGSYELGGIPIGGGVQYGQSHSRLRSHTYSVGADLTVMPVSVNADRNATLTVGSEDFRTIANGLRSLWKSVSGLFNSAKSKTGSGRDNNSRDGKSGNDNVRDTPATSRDNDSREIDIGM